MTEKLTATRPFTLRGRRVPARKQLIVLPEGEAPARWFEVSADEAEYLLNLAKPPVSRVAANPRTPKVKT